MRSSHHAVFKQLEQLTCAELHSSRRLVEILKGKLNLLDFAEFSHGRAGELAALFIEILKDTLEDRYQDLSIRAFAHLAVALDYFLDPEDAVLDPMEGGLVDDLVFLQKTHDRFKGEIERYRRWKAGEQRQSGSS